MKVHSEVDGLDDDAFTSPEMWDRFIDSKAINKNDAEDQIREYLEDSETAKQKSHRKFMMDTWGKDLPYSESRKKAFVEWKQELFEAEAQSSNMFYFCVRYIFFCLFFVCNFPHIY